MKVALLTTNNRIKSETELIEQFFMHGLDVLHLKKKNFSRKKTEEYLKLIPQQYHSKIILHSHHKLAVKYKTLGIHLGRSDRKRTFRTFLKLFLFRLFHPKLQFTTSCHSLNSASSDKRKYHHIMLSPIFDGFLKKTYSPAFSQRQLISINEKTENSIYALGGVDVSHIQTAKNDGFKGVVLYGSIWKNESDKVVAFREIVDIAHGNKKYVTPIKITPVKIKL